MTDKRRLTHLASRISEKRKSEIYKDVIVANPPHGEKGDFVKLTVTLPPEVYELIMKEVTRRKMAKEPNPSISAVIREAVVKQLQEGEER
jgi:transcriptional regulator of met regulon